MQNKTLKQKIQSGEKVVGTMIKVVDTIHVAKLLKDSGFDFFIIDNEHGFFDYKNLSDLCLYSRAIGFPAFIRIPQVTREIVLKCMDMGAAGLLLPSCETVKQAKDLVEFSKYSPLGDRGVNLFGAHAQYAPGNSVEYMKKANEETVLLIQMESPRGVENLAEILDVEGIDAAFVGPNDFSQSINLTGQFDHPLFEEYMDKIIDTCKEKGKFSGIHMSTIDGVKKWESRGMTVNLYSNEIAMMTNAAKADMKVIKG